MTEENKETQVEEKAPGLFEKALLDKKMKITALGVNASGVEMLHVEANDFAQICKDLKRSHKMIFLNYLTALEVKDGYQTVVQIENHEADFRSPESALILKATTAKENPQLPSLTTVYPNADWFEREAYDMVGINYEGHPNLTRILNPEDWEGYPLRKDYIGPIDELNQPIKLNA